MLKLRLVANAVLLASIATQSLAAEPPCPVATPEPFWVEPVTSPTDQTTQVIRVHIGNGDRVEIITEVGHFIAEGEFGAAAAAEIPVHLARRFTNHLEVVAHVKPATASGCTYGDYTLRATQDRFGAPLEIVQTGYPPSPTPVVTDVSSFSTFEFERRSALGFCPELDEVFSAAIRQRQGGYEVMLVILGRGTPGQHDCLPGDFFPPGACAVPLPLPTRNLTPDEIARMRDLFDDFPLLSGPDPSCEDTVYDPCLVNIVRWDTIGASDYPCTEHRISYPTVETVETFLEGLRPDRTPAPTTTVTPTTSASSPSPTPTPTMEPSPTYLPEPLLIFAFDLDPAHPSVGDLVTFRVSVHNTRGFAGQPQFHLGGAQPHFEVDAQTSEPSQITVLSTATLTYSLRAMQPGRADLSLGATYEICIGAGGNAPCYRGGSSSATVSVEIGEAESTATPEPSPTQAATPTATTTPGSGSGCAVQPQSSSATWLLCLVVLATMRTTRRQRVRTSGSCRRRRRPGTSRLRPPPPRSIPGPASDTANRDGSWAARVG